MTPFAEDGGRCIFQDVDALDLVTGEAAEFISTALYSVYDDEGAVVSKGASATDEDDRIIFTGLSGTVVHDDAGKTAGEALRQVYGRVLHQFRT